MSIEDTQLKSGDQPAEIRIIELARTFLMDRLSLDTVDDSASLLDMIDSVTLMSLIAFLEAKTGVAIQDEDIVPENFQNLVAIQELAMRVGCAGAY